MFRDLAFWMIGFGISVGLVFPFFVLTLRVPSAIALRPGFWVATVGAGVFVGIVNFAMARGVVVRRLRPLTRQMRVVQTALDDVVSGGDLSACDPESCYLPVDSADELGTVAGAFNRLLDAVARSHSVERAAADLVTTVARARNEQKLCGAALDKLLEHSGAAGGAIGIMFDGTPRACSHRDLPEHVTVAALALAAEEGIRHLSYPGGTVSVLPIRLGSAVAGMVALADRTLADATRLRLMTLLADSLGVALEALRLRDQLAASAVHDPLTGLANRRLFLDRTHCALLRAQRSDRRPAVVIIDLDDFKTINDCLGHGPGDELLIAVADRLRAGTRAEDTPARLGGDEFAILVEEPGGPVAVQALIDRLLQRLHEPVEIGGRTVRVTASIGLAIPGGKDTTTADSLLRDADTAMYTAKRSGKGQAQIFDPSLQAIAQRQLNIRVDLAGALDRGELALMYQPIVHLGTGAVVGVEALLRWTCSEHGPVPPSDFIPVAEETGLIHSIGRWAMREACAQAGHWQRRYADRAPYVAVNLSAVQVHDDQLPHIITEALAECGLPPEFLVLELTESLFVRNTERILTRLRDLRERGIRLALDDFGTGYSSLSYLDRLCFDIIKLDKTFIDQLDSDSRLCAGVLQLTRTLGLTTVAEGVERPEQARMLTALHCDLAQGYLYASPVPAEDIEAFLVCDPTPLTPRCAADPPELTRAVR